VNEELVRELVTSAVFTAGLTRSYGDIRAFVKELLSVAVGAMEGECEIFRLGERRGPYSESLWHFCFIFHSKKKRRVVLLSVRYMSSE
jgi:hypothetical protein